MHWAVEIPTYNFYNGACFNLNIFLMLIAASIPILLINNNINSRRSTSLYISAKVLNEFLLLSLINLAIYYSLGRVGSRYMAAYTKGEEVKVLFALSDASFEIFQGIFLLVVWSIVALRIIHGTDFNNKIKSVLMQTAFYISGINTALVFIYPTSKLISSFKKRKSMDIAKKRHKSPIKILLFIGLFLLLFCVGLFVKKGTSESISNYFNAHYIVDRFSTHLYHLSSILHIRESNSPVLNKLKSMVWTPFYDRANLLFFGVSKSKTDEEKSLAGYVNYQFYNSDAGSPAPGGSSLGLFASVSLFCPFPVNVCMVFCLFFFGKAFLKKLLFYFKEDLSWPGAFAFSYGPVRMITDDPFLLFNPLDTCFWILLIFTVLFMFLVKKRTPQGI